jgi:hypothetical protein
MTPTTCVYSERAFDGDVLDTIDMLLTRISHRLDRTRKGCVWTAWLGDEPVDVHAVRTADRLWDLDESDLARLALTAADVPTTVILGARTKSVKNLEALLFVEKELKIQLDGKLTGPT